MFKLPPPTGYWEPPMDLVSFEEQLQGTPQDLSPVDAPVMPASTPPISKQIIQENRGGERTGLGTKSMTRDATNNFGYMDKPGIVSAAGMLPGMLGMAGKAVNLGINANNQSAVSGARNMIGLPEQSGFEKAKGFVRDNKGMVSNNAKINDQEYSVGFEALSPDGRTNLTPNEALTRSNMLGGLEEMDPSAEQQAETKALDSSPFSGIFDKASSMLSSIFGDDDDQRDHMQSMGLAARAKAPTATSKEANPADTLGPWGKAGNVSKGGGYGHTPGSGQSVGPSGGGKSWGGPR